MTAKRYQFGYDMRLHGRRDFARVFAHGIRKVTGPLVVVGIPNGKSYCRLGLSVGRKVGIAVKRHRIKRLLREAFRLSQHDWPTGYDLIVVVRPHDIQTLAIYQRLLFTGIRSIHLRQSTNPASSPSASSRTPL